MVSSNMYLLDFVLMLYIKFPVRSLSGFLVFNRNKRNNAQIRDRTPPMFYRIRPKVILTLILNNILNFRIIAQAIL